MKSVYTQGMRLFGDVIFVDEILRFFGANTEKYKFRQEINDGCLVEKSVDSVHKLLYKSGKM